MKQPKYWSKAIKEISAKDPTMAEIFSKYKGETLKSKGNAFATLANAIIGQQVSVKAADATWQRFNKLFGRKKLSYQNFFQLKTQDLQAAGLSQQKINYLHNIASYFKTNKINEAYFQNKDKAELEQELLAIKGIGRWTLEMFQIFYLLEPDIFPKNDLGLIKAIAKHYPNKSRRDKAQAEWQPYRTVVTWYLWRSLDPEPVAY